VSVNNEEVVGFVEDAVKWHLVQSQQEGREDKVLDKLWIVSISSTCRVWTWRSFFFVLARAKRYHDSFSIIWPSFFQALVLTRERPFHRGRYPSLFSNYFPAAVSPLEAWREECVSKGCLVSIAVSLIDLDMSCSSKNLYTRPLTLLETLGFSMIFRWFHRLANLLNGGSSPSMILCLCYCDTRTFCWCTIVNLIKGKERVFTRYKITIRLSSSLHMRRRTFASKGYKFEITTVLIC